MATLGKTLKDLKTQKNNLRTCQFKNIIESSKTDQSADATNHLLMRKEKSDIPLVTTDGNKITKELQVYVLQNADCFLMSCNFVVNLPWLIFVCLGQ